MHKRTLPIVFQLYFVAQILLSYSIDAHNGNLIKTHMNQILIIINFKKLSFKSTQGGVFISDLFQVFRKRVPPFRTKYVDRPIGKLYSVSWDNKFYFSCFSKLVVSSSCPVITKRENIRL